MKLPFQIHGQKLYKKVSQKLTRLYRTKRVLFIAVCAATFLLVSGSSFALWKVIQPDQINSNAQSSPQSNNTIAPKDNNSQPTAEPNTAAPSSSAAAQKPGSSGSTYTPGSRVMSPHDNCPPAYQPPKDYGPGGYTFPPAIRKTMPAKTVTIPYGKTSGTFSFTSPDDVALGFASYLGSPGSGASAQVLSGYMTPTVTVSVKPGSSDGFTHYLKIGSVCYEYEMPIYFNYEPAPALNFNITSYNEASNALNFTAAGQITTMQISYTINGCDPAAGNLCYGTDYLTANTSNGAVDLNPLFPEIDDYFAQYTATSLTLTINPAAPGYQTNSDSILFYWE